MHTMLLRNSEYLDFGMESNKKKREEPKFIYCAVCNCPVPNVPSNIEKHFKGNAHKRLAELRDNEEKIKAWNIKWPSSGEKLFSCQTCGLPLDPQFSTLKQHFIDHEKPQVKPQEIPIIEVCKVYQPKSYYKSEAYNILFQEQKNFDEVPRSCDLEDIGTSVGKLRPNVFPDVVCNEFYKISSLLEQHGDEKPRSKRKGASRMVMFGLYCKGFCGWYVHEKLWLHTIAEQFATDVAKYLKVEFSDMFTKLERNLVIPGLE